MKDGGCECRHGFNTSVAEIPRFELKLSTRLAAFSCAVEKERAKRLDCRPDHFLFARAELSPLRPISSSLVAAATIGPDESQGRFSTVSRSGCTALTDIG